jgi:hypothetical protein
VRGRTILATCRPLHHAASASGRPAASLNYWRSGCEGIRAGPASPYATIGLKQIHGGWNVNEKRAVPSETVELVRRSAYDRGAKARSGQTISRLVRAQRVFAATRVIDRGSRLPRRESGRVVLQVGWPPGLRLRLLSMPTAIPPPSPAQIPTLSGH